MAKVYLEITLKVDQSNRANAAGVYNKYKAPFLETIQGALSKELLVREQDVQVLHGFESGEHAQAYLGSDLFSNDVVTSLQPYWKEAPEIRLYTVA